MELEWAVLTCHEEFRLADSSSVETAASVSRAITKENGYVFGVLNLHKPAGKTSRDIVNIVQRLARPAKVGHAGTLDPIATGVLLTCVGPATRLIAYAQRLEKRYLATFQLGQRSETEDIEGDIELLDNPPHPTMEQIAGVLVQFTGDILQVPPAFSALKVKGQRAYKLARRGEEVVLHPRPITIHAIDVMRYEYPEVVLDIRCGSGTYIRSLGRDIARALGSEAVMSALSRTAIGPFTVETAVDPAKLDRDNLARWLMPGQALLDELPTVTLTAVEIDSIATGRVIENRFAAEAAEVIAISASGKLLAILKRKDQREPRHEDQLRRQELISFKKSVTCGQFERAERSSGAPEWKTLTAYWVMGLSTIGQADFTKRSNSLPQGVSICSRHGMHGTCWG